MLELKDLKRLPTKEIELKEFLYKRLREQVAKTQAYRMADCFDRCASGTGLLVLLDGLDEVASTDYRKVRDAINGLSYQLAQLSANNKILLTMRIQFHQQIKDDFVDTFGQVLLVKPFNPSDIYDFLTRWPFAERKQDNISRIYRELTERPTLREICTNPLVLAMYVAEDQSSNDLAPPESRTHFYAKVTEELLIKRRQRQLGAGMSVTALKEQREKILGRLAYEHLLAASEPTNSLSWDKALRVVQGVMKCDSEAAANVFDELATATGLISEERHRETFRFIHLTFCEFLAAFEAVEGREQGWSDLIAAHEGFKDSADGQLRSRLLEVIPFAAGLLKRGARTRAFADLRKLQDRALLLRAFLETKQYDDPSWPILVASEKKELLRIGETGWNEDWLRDLYLFNVVVRDANVCAQYLPVAGGIVDLAPFFKELVSQQKGIIGTLLDTYADQDAVAAMSLTAFLGYDLAEDFPEIAIKNCDQAPFFEMLLAQSDLDLKDVCLRASLFIEAALYSSLVAKWMISREPSPSWVPYISDVPETSCWLGPESLISRCLYSQCLTIALNPPDQLDLTSISQSRAFSSVRLLSNLHPPGSFIRTLRIANYAGVLTFVALLALLTLNVWFVKIPLARSAAAIMIAVISCSLCWLRVRAIRRCYRSIYPDGVLWQFVESFRTEARREDSVGIGPRPRVYDMNPYKAALRGVDVGLVLGPSKRFGLYVPSVLNAFTPRQLRRDCDRFLDELNALNIRERTTDQVEQGHRVIKRTSASRGSIISRNI